jgi:protein subunit release factor A
MIRFNLIPLEELKVETFNPRPPGGQHVLEHNTGVKITHLPTGMVAICACGGSQHRNRKIALDMILGGLTSPHHDG